MAEKLLQEKFLRSQYGKAVNSSQATVLKNKVTKEKQIVERVVFNEASNGRDVFGNEKVNDSSTYFHCDNCNRNIAGSRFANHINRCLGGRNSRKD